MDSMKEREAHIAKALKRLHEEFDLPIRGDMQKTPPEHLMA